MRHLHFAFAAGLLLALAGVAGGRELEPGPTLEGFPFASASSLSFTADGKDLYATGRHALGTTAPGLVWLRRDPESGDLAFRRNYLSAGSEPRVLGAALGRGDTVLHVLLRDRLLLAARGADGELTPAAETAFPDTFAPYQLVLSPLGSRLAVLGRSGNEEGIRFYDVGLAGAPAFRRQVPVPPQLVDGLFLDEDTLLSGRFLLRQAGGNWKVELAEALRSFGYVGWALAGSDPGRVYVHAGLGLYPQLELVAVALTFAGGQLTETGRSPLAQSNDRVDSVAAIDPASGDLYVASGQVDTGNFSRLHRYRVTAGGDTFVPAGVLEDPFEDPRGTRKEGLGFSPDGRHLYTSFGGEPLARLAIGIPDGAGPGLVYEAGAAGSHSHLFQPLAIRSVAPREAYVLTPAAIVQVAWNGEHQDGGLAPVSSLPLADWPQWRRQPAWDFVLPPGGGIGVLASGGDLVMVERDARSGALRFLPESTRPSEENVKELELSPDGRHLYVLGESHLQVYAVDRGARALVPVQEELPTSALHFRLSDDGATALLLRERETPLELRRDSRTGILEFVPFGHPGAGNDVVDALFSRQGRLLHLFHATPFPTLPGYVEVLARQPGGGWSRLDDEETRYTENGRQAVDAGGNALYQLGDEGIALFQLVNRYPAFELKALPRLSPGELGGVGARERIPPRQPTTPLALFPGGGELLVANFETGNLRLFSRGCGPDLDGGACLTAQRFRVEVLWRDAQGVPWPAQVSPLGSADAQIFSFFEPGNWEMMVKVLDGCGLNDRFWIFAAASTDVGFEIRVQDTWSGESKVYDSAAGAPAPAITDTAAFATCGAPWPGFVPVSPVRPTVIARPDGLELGDRFVAKATWRTAAGQSGQGVGLRTLEIQPSGLFYFFSPDNWEVQLKVLDGCALNGHYWVFGAATTDVGYTLEIRDTLTGRTRGYENPIGRASPAITDISAFSCN